MPFTDAGKRLFKNSVGQSSLSFSPLTGRAAIVRRILIDKPSAADQWVVTCLGREVARFDIQILGNQQPLSGPNSGYPKENDIFEVMEDYFQTPLIFPVPEGATFTVASVGGATANISFSYYECTPEECSPNLMNHPAGRLFVSPVIFYRVTAVTAAGENYFDTEVKPIWWPYITLTQPLPPGYKVRLLSMFLEGGGRNTFNGAADHRSNTQYVSVHLRGQLLWTRDNSGGIPNVGQAAAAGSANTVIGADATFAPAFQYADPYDYQSSVLPIDLNEGDNPLFSMTIAGDVTGGADYSAIRNMMLVELRTS